MVAAGIGAIVLGLALWCGDGVCAVVALVLLNPSGRRLLAGTGAWSARHLPSDVIAAMLACLEWARW